MLFKKYKISFFGSELLPPVDKIQKGMSIPTTLQGVEIRVGNDVFFG